MSNSPQGPPLARYASVAHVARVYDYLLGGKDNVAAARDAAEPGLARVPEWRPALASDAAAPAQMWAGVALKP